ncbi:hypothetical protein L1887_57158 [Cichorium endivia]|nr:hypothetical protein L1887_57158 [Cichorium endivia]
MVRNKRQCAVLRDALSVCADCEPRRCDQNQPPASDEPCIQSQSEGGKEQRYPAAGVESGEVSGCNPAAARCAGCRRALGSLGSRTSRGISKPTRDAPRAQPANSARFLPRPTGCRDEPAAVARPARVLLVTVASSTLQSCSLLDEPRSFCFGPI